MIVWSMTYMAMYTNKKSSENEADPQPGHHKRTVDCQEMKGEKGSRYHWTQKREKQVKLYMSNVTSWSQMAEDYCGLEFKQDVLFIGEHRHKDKDLLERKMKRKGWSAAIEAAATGQGGGSSAGTMIAWK